jgi:transcriptional regulator with XRE-family HTH domain
MIHPLKAARLKRNLTQQMLADFTCLSVPTIKRAEKGKPVRVDVRRQLCEYFGMTAEELGLLTASEQAHDVAVEQEEEERGPLPPAPFADGRLLWTLYLGVEAGRLQCRISCPLANGEVWEMVLDPQMSGADIQSIYQIVQEHVLMQGIKRYTSEQEIASPKVLRFGPLAR